MARTRKVYKRQEMVQAVALVGYLATLREAGLHRFKGVLPHYKECLRAGRIFIQIDRLYAAFEKVRTADGSYSHLDLARKLKLSRQGLYVRMGDLYLRRGDLIRASSVAELQSGHPLLAAIIRRYQTLKKQGVFRAARFRDFF